MNDGKRALSFLLLFALPIASAQAGAFFSPAELVPDPSYKAQPDTEFERISVDASGNQLYDPLAEPYGSIFPAISQNGRYVGFTVTQRDGTSPDPAEDKTQSRLKDRVSGQLYTPSTSDSVIVDIASSGLTLYVENILSSSEKQLKVYDPATGLSEQVNLNTAGSELPIQEWTEPPYRAARITPNGQYVVFSSTSSDQVSIWRRDLASGTTELLTSYTNTTQSSPNLVISDLNETASEVVFLSNQPIDASDGNESTDVYYVELGSAPVVVSDPAGTGIAGSVSASAMLVGQGLVRYATDNIDILAQDQTGLPFDPATLQQENPNTQYFGVVVERDTATSAVEAIAPLHIENGDMQALDGGVFDIPTPMSMSSDGTYIASLMTYNGGTNNFQFAQQVLNLETGEYEVFHAGQLGVLMMPVGPAFSQNGESFAFATAANDLVAGDNNTVSVEYEGQIINALVSDIYIRNTGVNSDEGLLDVVPESTSIDPNATPSTHFDVRVSESDLYGVEVSCTIQDETLLPVVGGSYGDIFDPNQRLEVTQTISSEGDSWDGAMSLKYPAEPIIANDAWFSTVDMTVMPTSGVATVTCTGLASDIEGNAIDLGSDTETITLDDGIHCLQGACTDVSGVVTYPFLEDHSDIVVTITTPDGITVTTTTGPNGEYSFENIRDGAYSVSYESPEYVQECTAVNIDGGEYAPIADKVMIAGDINDDDVIDISDFTLLAAKFGLSSGDEGFEEKTDLNNDGTVNIQDLSILGSHFGYNHCLPALEEEQQQ